VKTLIRSLALLLTISGTLPASDLAIRAPDPEQPDTWTTGVSHPDDLRIEPQIKRSTHRSMHDESKAPAVPPTTRIDPIEPSEPVARTLHVKIARLEKFRPFFDSLSCP